MSKRRQRRPRVVLAAVRESAGAVLDGHTRTEVCEASVGGASVAPSGRLLCRLIKAGWSLNGNLYPAAVLRKAAADGMFGKGTQAFADHATDTEEEDRPSGSIKNLAGVLETNARWDEGEQALMAEVRLFEPWKAPILDMAESIGMSIRAWVHGDYGQQDGQSGFVVSEIVSSRSVDFVTVPAAGGSIVSVLEAVGNQIPQPIAEARNCGHWFEAQIHSSFTQLADRQFGEGYLTRDERIALSGAVGDALAAFASRIQADAPHLYERDPWREPEPMAPAEVDEAPTADAEESAPASPTVTAVAVSEDVTDGAPPTDPTNPTEEEPTMSDTQNGPAPGTAGTAGTATVVDTPPPTTPATEATAANAAVIAAMEALTRQVTALSEQNTALVARADQRDAADRTARNRQAAREAVAAALAAPEVPADLREQIAPRVTVAVLAAIPTAESGEVDAIALGEAITAAIAAESGYAARLLESAGVGRPRGLGGASEPEQTTEQFETALAEGFKALGLNAAAATIAARGRG